MTDAFEHARRLALTGITAALAVLKHTSVLLMLVATSAVAESVTTSEALQTEIQQLRAEQERIAEMERRLSARLHAMETAGVTSASGQPRLAVSGDLRVRAQGDYAENSRDRESAQVRGRIGASYSINDRVTIGARLATGDADDPNSTDVQLSNFDDDLQLQLSLGHLALYGGKMPQSFTRTELVWDADVNPQGLSAIYKKSFGGGSVLRANGLFFILDENTVAADSTMVGSQLGYDLAASEDLKLDISAAYYDYHLGSVAGADAGDFRSNLRNPDGNYRSDFDLGDIIVGATWTGANDRWPVRAVGDYVHNFGAATSQDTGYGLDVTVGRVRHSHDWRLTYGFAVAETDSVLAAFSHDNLAVATDYRLHAFTLDYVPLPKTLISATWSHYKPYEAVGPGGSDWIDRVRLGFLVSL